MPDTHLTAAMWASAAAVAALYSYCCSRFVFGGWSFLTCLGSTTRTSQWIRSDVVKNLPRRIVDVWAVRAILLEYVPNYKVLYVEVLSRHFHEAFSCAGKT